MRSQMVRFRQFFLDGVLNDFSSKKSARVDILLMLKL